MIGLASASIKTPVKIPISGTQNATEARQADLSHNNQMHNTDASIREFLGKFPSDLVVTSVSSIDIQASAMAQLTQSIHQLTPSTSVTRNTSLSSTPIFILTLD